MEATSLLQKVEKECYGLRLIPWSGSLPLDNAPDGSNHNLALKATSIQPCAEIGCLIIKMVNLASV